MVSKGADADKWLDALTALHNPPKIFIDAPLSIPAAYYGKGTDFAFRRCDRECKAMSPMFLGGLTARAMAYAHRFPNVGFVEAYPKKCAQVLGVSHAYHGHLASFVDLLAQKLPFGMADGIRNWHQVDSVLAWAVGMRYQQGMATCVGNPDEGLIYA